MANESNSSSASRSSSLSVGLLVYTAVDQTKMYMVTVAEFLGPM